MGDFNNYFIDIESYVPIVKGYDNNGSNIQLYTNLIKQRCLYITNVQKYNKYLIFFSSLQNNEVKSEKSTILFTYF